MSPLSQLDKAAAEAERQTIIVEAKVMVERLGVLMDLVGTWAEEGWEDDVA